VSAAVAASPQAWCTFRLGDGHYGVALAHVQEVLRPLPVTRLPLAPRSIAGLMNLRGRIVPVVDVRELLGCDAVPDAAGGLVVVQSDDGPVALLVDAIGDVRRAEASAPPSALPAEPARDDGGALVERTLALPGELLVVLDLDRVLARAFASPVEARP
jgi:purine-binding chemotaxis protein CheW